MTLGRLSVADVLAGSEAMERECERPLPARRCGRPDTTAGRASRDKGALRATCGVLAVSALAVLATAWATKPQAPPTPRLEGARLDFSLTEVDADWGLYLLTTGFHMPDTLPFPACTTAIFGIFSRAHEVVLGEESPKRQHVHAGSAVTNTYLIRVFANPQSLWQRIVNRARMDIRGEVSGVYFRAEGDGTLSDLYTCWAYKDTASFQVRPLSVDDFYKATERLARRRGDNPIVLTPNDLWGVPDSLLVRFGLDEQHDSL